MLEEESSFWEEGFMGILYDIVSCDLWILDNELWEGIMSTFYDVIMR